MTVNTKHLIDFYRSQFRKEKEEKEIIKCRVKRSSSKN